MEIEETVGSSLFFYRPIKLLAMDIFIEKLEGNGNKVFHAFEFYNNAHEVGTGLLKKVLTWTNQSCSTEFDFPEFHPKKNGSIVLWIIFVCLNIPVRWRTCWQLTIPTSLFVSTNG